MKADPISDALRAGGRTLHDFIGATRLETKEPPWIDNLGKKNFKGRVSHFRKDARYGGIDERYLPGKS